MQGKNSLTPNLLNAGSASHVCLSSVSMNQSMLLTIKKESTKCFGYPCMVQQHQHWASFSAAMSWKLYFVLLFLVAFSELCICIECGSAADQVGKTPPTKNLQGSSHPDGTAIDGITHSAFFKAGYGIRQLPGPMCPNGCRGLPGVHVCCGIRGCKNILSNRYHCGACHRPCLFGQACCGGFCVDILNDMRHCGRCGTACAAGVPCAFGMCGYSLG